MQRHALIVLSFLVACGEVKAPITDATPAIDAADALLPDAADLDAPPGMVTLTVVKGGAATGTVASTPSGINCGATCVGSYPVGTVVTLTATADVGTVFSGWGGSGCSGTLTSCSITLNASTAVNADFGVAQYPVTVAISGNGTGAVTSTPAGINCPGGCTTMVAHGSSLVLTAAPTTGSAFLGWSGGCTGTGACTLTVESAVTVNASFALDGSLVVTKVGNGAGAVTSSPAGINCGADCAEAYPFGTVVALAAAASAGSTFTGWSGGGCTGAGACSVTMNMSKMVNATFALNQYPLTVAKAGTGTGTVTSSPGGITCGADCTETVNHGALVTLAAAASADSTFAGWSGGGCSGTGTCAVTVTAATTVTATFTVRQFTLTVTRTGNGLGTVTGTGIDCPGDCTEIVNAGTAVTLDASTAAGSGSSFTGWTGGGCSGTGTCTVTITAATSVSAAFTLSGPGGALQFDGQDDLAVLGSGSPLDNRYMTVEFWMKLEGWGGAPVSLWSGTALGRKYTVAIQNGTMPTANGRVVLEGGATGAVQMPFALGAWVHVGVVFDGAGLAIYQNGTLAASMRLEGALQSFEGPLRLGIEDTIPTRATFLNGQLDEVRIWNVARTAAQMRASWDRIQPAGVTGLVSQFHFDELTGQSIQDSVGRMGGVLGSSNLAERTDPRRVESTAPINP